MNILILGSDGFIGYHLQESILKDDRFKDATITGVDLYNIRTHMLSEDGRRTFHQLNVLTVFFSIIKSFINRSLVATNKCSQRAIVKKDV